MTLYWVILMPLTGTLIIAIMAGIVSLRAKGVATEARGLAKRANTAMTNHVTTHIAEKEWKEIPPPPDTGPFPTSTK